METISSYINQLRVIDTHEHLATPQKRKQEKHDFFNLLHYIDSDLATAGMPRGVLEKQTEMSTEEKIEIFLRYWEKTKNTTYARMLKTALNDLYGFNDWSLEGLIQLNEKIKINSQSDTWYNKILVEKSKIDIVLDLIDETSFEYGMFKSVMFMDFFFSGIRTTEGITRVEEISGVKISSFQGYLNVVENLIDRFSDEGVLSMKFGHAYWRTLDTAKVGYAVAESIFIKMSNSNRGESVKHEEAKILEDFLIHHIIKCSIKRDIPIQIHTGHLEPCVSGDGNVITNSNVTHLIPLLLEYKDAKFILLHSGYPYSEQYLSIVKNYHNVYADLTWVYILSPTMAKRILHQMIEMVPMNKIQGFGGDYCHIEGVYAHLKLARKILSEVLEEKVADGSLDYSEALEFANNIFRNNPIEIYRLNIDIIKEKYQ